MLRLETAFGSIAYQEVPSSARQTSLSRGNNLLNAFLYLNKFISLSRCCAKAEVLGMEKRAKKKFASTSGKDTTKVAQHRSGVCSHRQSVSQLVEEKKYRGKKPEKGKTAQEAWEDERGSS